MSKECKCEHWQQCPVCMPHRFDSSGHLLPPEPTPLQAARNHINELEVEIEALKAELAQADELEKNLRWALQNCRLFAARHRKEDWALLILGFCAEGGVTGSITRDNSEHHGPDWTERDGEYLK